MSTMDAATAAQKVSVSVTVTLPTSKPHVSSTSETTWQLAWDTSKAGWNEDDPALSIASGGHGRLYPSSGYPTTLHDTGVIRCRVGAWARLRSASGTGYVRVQVSRWSYVDIPVTGTTWAWHEVEAHLEVGRGPVDTANCRVYVQSQAAANQTYLRYAYATFLPDETVSTM